jgi:hypothetical protein
MSEEQTLRSEDNAFLPLSSGQNSLLNDYLFPVPSCVSVRLAVFMNT